MKTLLSFLILPFSFTIVLIGIGLVLRWYKKQRLGKIIMITGGILLLFFASYPGSWLTLKPLESKYEPLNITSSIKADYVVVLGGGCKEDTSLPSTARLTQASTRRLTEGIRIHKKIPGSTLVLSGGTDEDRISSAEMQLKVMQDLELSTDSVIVNLSPLNTQQEAEVVKEKIGDKHDIVLVTSAYHMPRAVALFNGQGIEVIPAPADHLITQSDEWGLSHFLWHPRNLKKSHRAFHEYVGMLWAWLNGDLSF